MNMNASIVIAAMVGGTLAPVASADLLVSNLGSSSIFTATSSYIDQIYNPVYAGLFVTGDDPSVVLSATARLNNASGYGLATYEAYLYADDGMSPGSLVATFDTTPTIADGGGTVNVDLTSILGIALDPNTSYWFGVYNTTGRWTGWETASSDAESSTAGWTIDDDAASLLKYGASGWEDYSNRYNGKVFKFSINGNVVPAPGALALLAAGGAIAARRRRG